MGFIFEINRDFPYQVPLSFDEAAMEVPIGSKSAVSPGICMSIYLRTL
jgi:hypothetical protein